jgi:Zn-dependent protease with chaperone function
LREYAAQTILHALVAAGVIEVLLRVWRLGDPAERLVFRLLALTLPLAVGPIFFVFAPFRSDPAFADTLAIFASAHWRAVRLGSIDPGTVVLVAATLAGALLYVRDLVPLVRGAREREGHGCMVGDEQPLARTVGELSKRAGLPAPPRVCLLDDDAPVLLASGVTRPSLAISRGALARLGGAELRATLAHELVHLSRGDVLLGWIVMVVRTIMVFNPIAQLVARGVIVEMERRADDTAARLVEAPSALADGMERLVGEHLEIGASRASARSLVLDGLVLGLAARGRLAALAGRCRRLRDGWPPPSSALPGFRVGMTGVAIAVLLFFVV